MIANGRRRSRIADRKRSQRMLFPYNRKRSQRKVLSHVSVLGNYENYGLWAILWLELISEMFKTVMACNQILTILSVGPNHLGSYLISPSVNTSVSPAKNHLYSPSTTSTKRLWNLAIQRKILVYGCQAILPRTSK